MIVTHRIQYCYKIQGSTKETRVYRGSRPSLFPKKTGTGHWEKNSLSICGNIAPNRGGPCVSPRITVPLEAEIIKSSYPSDAIAENQSPSRERTQNTFTSPREHFVTLHGHDHGDTWMSQRPISTSASDAAPSWQPTGGHLFFSVGSL